MPTTDPQPVAIDTTERDGRLVVAVAGEIDAASAEDFEARLLPAVGGATAVSFDLAGVAFIDSSGLRALMAAQQDVAGRGGSIELTETSTVVDRLLAVTGLGELFTRPA